MLNNDLLNIADGTVAVTYRRHNDGTETSVPQALLRRSRRMIDHPGEAPLVPVFWGDWYLPMSLIPESPQPGDQLEEADGRVWYVQRAIPSERNGILRCLAFRYEARFGPEDRMDLLRLADSSPEPTYVTMASNVSAKLSAPVTTYSQTETGQTIIETCYILTRSQFNTAQLAAIRRSSDGRIYTARRVKLPEINGGWTEIEVAREL